MKQLTPAYGPLRGVPCWVERDGTLVPVGDTPPAHPEPLPAGVLDDDTGPAAAVLSPGEIPGPDTRNNIARLARDLEQAGFRNPHERAYQAAQRWDRGVRSGSVQYRRP